MSIYHRPAREYPERLATQEVSISPPPSQSTMQQGPLAWLQYLIPVVGSFGSIIFVIIYHNIIMLIGAGILILASIGGGLLAGSQQRGMQKKRETWQKQRYKEYLSEMKGRFETGRNKQTQNELRLNPPTLQLMDIINQREQKGELWQRRYNDEDFLSVRIGTGAVACYLSPHVDKSSDPLTMYDSILLKEAEQLEQDFTWIQELPICIPLRSLGVVSLSGNSTTTRAMTRAIIARIITSSSPEDVRIFIYYPESLSAEWKWITNVPHFHRAHLANEQYIQQAHTPDEFRQVIEAQLMPEIDRRRKLISDNQQSQSGSFRPHFVLIIDTPSATNLMNHIPSLRTLLHEACDLGISILFLLSDRSDEPELVHGRIQVKANQWVTYSEANYGGLIIDHIKPDALDPAEGEKIARALAPISLGDQQNQLDMASEVRLLDLHAIGAPQTIDLSTAWCIRSHDDLLRFPIGKSIDGKIVFLDVKESAEGGMGPHGMLIGATGSGKSELLRTMITSLALTHDPETVNFVLADFKGGASFAEFEQLPHTAGLITNLQDDPHLIERMKLALYGELDRRQQMLYDAGKLENIRRYHQQRSQESTLKPLPYLVVVVDEFAELLTLHPDFLDVFTKIGRQGRSLGICMLLSTQRLGEGRIQGLESYLSYRICLRTFNASESSTVLGSADAFFLPSYPGVGYFKVDTRIYQLFKSAIISTPIVSADDQQSGPAGRLDTTMKAAIHFLAEHSSFPKVHQVWLPPLASYVTLQQIQGNSANTVHQQQLCVPVGLLDLPSQQKQKPLEIDFSGAAGHLAIVGAVQSGKSVFLQTLLLSLCLSHKPANIQIYGIDYGGGLLFAFEALPHVGAICGRGEHSKIAHTIRQLRNVIEERETRFRKDRIVSIEEYRKNRQMGKYPDDRFGDIFLFIDDIGQLLGAYEELLADIIDISAVGLAYGIHLIVSANRWNDIKPKLQDNIGNRVELRLNDPENSQFGKAVSSKLLKGPPGRGILKNGTIFQTAFPLVAPFEDRQQLPLLAKHIRATQFNGDAPAPQIRLLPLIMKESDVMPLANQGICLGIDEFHLQPVMLDPFKGDPHFLIFGDQETGKTNILRLWLEGLKKLSAQREIQVGIIDFRRNLAEFRQFSNLLGYAHTPAKAKELAGEIQALCAQRILANASQNLPELNAGFKGSHIFLIVDDYELVPSGANNPLMTLYEAILQSRDIGFHIILARQVAGMSRNQFADSVLQQIRESGSAGIILSGDSQEGQLIANQRANILPPGRGFLVRRKVPTTLVQTLLSPLTPDV